MIYGPKCAPTDSRSSDNTPGRKITGDLTYGIGMATVLGQRSPGEAADSPRTTHAPLCHTILLRPRAPNVGFLLRKGTSLARGVNYI